MGRRQIRQRLVYAAILWMAACWCAVNIAAADAGQTANILSNGGFEDGAQPWLLDAQQQLVVDPAVAHSGAACVTGEVTQPNHALRLQRSVPVQAGNRYEFEIWARGTNRTKLVLWATLPGNAARTMIASWPNQKRQWQRFRVPVSVSKTGVLQLEIIAPSSHGAPAGRLWIDDIALYETEMPPLWNVTGGQGFSDEPAMAVAEDGSVYVAYNRFVDDADCLEVTRLLYDSGQWQKAGQWQIEGGPGTYLLSPDAVSMGDRVAVTYAIERDRDWEIEVVECGPEGPRAPLRVTQTPGVDAKPDIAFRDGKLWIAWESNRSGGRQIFVAAVDGSKVSPAVPLSVPNESSYDPSITLLPRGEVCVAWHGFHDGNYDLYLRRSTATGQWGEVQRLTHAPAIDRHATLFTCRDQLWVAYESAQTERYYVTRTNRRHLVVARVTKSGLQAPVAQGPSPLDGRCEAASAGFDAQGRLWVAMLRPRLPRAGWDTYLTGLVDGRWLTPLALSCEKGLDRTPSLALCDGRAVVAFQSDNTPQSWSDVDQMAKASSDVYLARIDTSHYPAAANMRLEPLIESSEVFEPAAIRKQRGEDLPSESIDYEGRQYHLYFGDLHEHSDVSICNRVGDQSLDESYQHLRDLARHDFVCITDHGYNLSTYLWNYSAKWARVNDDPNRFVTFLGQEWTSTFEDTDHDHPYGYYGHRNLILADLYFPTWWNARNRQKPTEVWDDLRRMHANFVHIPHQLADTGNVPTDWNFHDEVAQPVAEIFQTRGSYEYFGAPRQAPRTIPGPGSFLQDAWARNIVIGVIASPDHGGGYGKACVYADELTRESILDAPCARRCYGTTAAKIFLDVRINGHLMGEKRTQPAGDRVQVEVSVRCCAPIDKIELCRDNQYIAAKSPPGLRAEVTFVDDSPPAGRCYYYVRVTQQDNEIAWSSPVWFGVSADKQPPGDGQSVEPAPNTHSENKKPAGKL